MQGRTLNLLTNNEGIGLYIGWCKFMLREFSGGRSKLTCKVLTGNETWIYRYDPKTKMRSVVWLFLDEFPCTPKTLKVMQHTDENGCLFLFKKKKKSRHHSSRGQTDWTVTADWYMHHNHSSCGQTDSHCRLVCASVFRRSSKFGARPSEDVTPWPPVTMPVRK